MGKLITVPFGWLLGQLYALTDNYGVAMIIFAVIVQSVLLPIRAKSKKSMMKMSRMQPKIQAIQEKYANDEAKKNEEMQKLQKEEGGMGLGGCLWSLVPMLILFPLFNVIREPIVYILGESAEVAKEIVTVIKTCDPTLFTSNTAYEQVVAATAITQYAPEIQAAISSVSEATLNGINFDFLGINLGNIPRFNIFAWDAYNWANIGLFLIPVVSAGSQLLQTLVSQKTNNSVITNEKGIQDKEIAENSQQNQSMKGMMWMFPILSLWIGFSVSAGLSLYWFVGGLFSMLTEPIMTKHYRKIYDAEDAERLKRHMAEEAAEAERERIRAERRAANPDGQTQNTSKKKLQKMQKEADEAAKAAALKEYNARKGIVEEEAAPAADCPSGIPERPYCKGRNYQKNRYGKSSTEE